MTSFPHIVESQLCGVDLVGGEKGLPHNGDNGWNSEFGRVDDGVDPMTEVVLDLLGVDIAALVMGTGAVAPAAAVAVAVPATATVALAESSSPKSSFRGRNLRCGVVGCRKGEEGAELVVT